MRARRLAPGYVNDAVLKELERDLNRVGAPLSGLIRSIRVSKTVVNAIVALVSVATLYCLV